MADRSAWWPQRDGRCLTVVRRAWVWQRAVLWPGLRHSTAAQAVLTELVIPAQVEIPVPPVDPSDTGYGVTVSPVGNTSEASMGGVEGPASPSGRLPQPGRFF